MKRLLAVLFLVVFFLLSPVTVSSVFADWPDALKMPILATYKDQQGSESTITVRQFPANLAVDNLRLNKKIFFVFQTPKNDFFKSDIYYTYIIKQLSGGVTNDIKSDRAQFNNGVLSAEFNRDFIDATIGTWEIKLGYGKNRCPQIPLGNQNLTVDSPLGCASIIEQQILTQPFRILPTGGIETEPRVCVKSPVAKEESIKVSIQDAAANSKYTVWVDGKRLEGSTVFSSDFPPGTLTGTLTGTLKGLDSLGPNKICMHPGDSGSADCNKTYNTDITVMAGISSETPIKDSCSTQSILTGGGVDFGLQEPIPGFFCEPGKEAASSAGFSPKTTVGISTAIGCIPIGIRGGTNEFVAWVLRWAIGISGGVAFLLMLYSGFQIMTASGNPERLQKGRELLTAAISGLILIIFSVFLLRLIGVDILNLPGFGT